MFKFSRSVIMVIRSYNEAMTRTDSLEYSEFKETGKFCKNPHKILNITKHSNHFVFRFMFSGSGEESASSLTIFAAVAGVLGVVVLALIVALVMLFKRYRSPQNAARVVYTKASRDDGKLLV